MHHPAAASGARQLLHGRNEGRGVDLAAAERGRHEQPEEAALDQRLGDLAGQAPLPLGLLHACAQDGIESARGVRRCWTHRLG